MRFHKTLFLKSILQNYSCARIAATHCSRLINIQVRRGEGAHPSLLHRAMAQNATVYGTPQCTGQLQSTPPFSTRTTPRNFLHHDTPRSRVPSYSRPCYTRQPSSEVHKNLKLYSRQHDVKWHYIMVEQATLSRATLLKGTLRNLP